MNYLEDRIAVKKGSMTFCRCKALPNKKSSIIDQTSPNLVRENQKILGLHPRPGQSFEKLSKLAFCNSVDEKIVWNTKSWKY